MVPPAPGYIQIGVSVEPLAELAAKEGSRLGERTGWAQPAAVARAQRMGTSAALSMCCVWFDCRFYLCCSKSTAVCAAGWWTCSSSLYFVHALLLCR